MFGTLSGVPLRPLNTSLCCVVYSVKSAVALGRDGVGMILNIDLVICTCTMRIMSISLRWKTVFHCGMKQIYLKLDQGNGSFLLAFCFEVLGLKGGRFQR